MNQKQAKKNRRKYRKTIEEIARSDLRKTIYKICRQRDWIALIAIVEFITIGVLAWMLY